jgi:hypothetical protein
MFIYAILLTLLALSIGAIMAYFAMNIHQTIKENAADV